jgi:hypothetical protein
MRVNNVTVLQGAVVPIWGTLEQLLDKYAMQLSKGEAALSLCTTAGKDCSAHVTAGEIYKAWRVEKSVRYSWKVACK